jgi:hypothetical protein
MYNKPPGNNKHQPTIIQSDSQREIDILHECCEIIMLRQLLHRPLCRQRSNHPFALHRLFTSQANALCDSASTPIYRSAKDLSSCKVPPCESQSLVRDFIGDSLTNPHYGYFSKHAAIFTTPSKAGYAFPQFRDNMAFMTQLSRDYKDFEEALEEEFPDMETAPRQVWHTPTEIFKVCVCLLLGTDNVLL